MRFSSSSTEHTCNVCLYEQSVNHISLKNGRPGCYLKSRHMYQLGNWEIRMAHVRRQSGGWPNPYKTAFLADGNHHPLAVPIYLPVTPVHRLVPIPPFNRKVWARDYPVQLMKPGMYSCPYLPVVFPGQVYDHCLFYHTANIGLVLIA